MRSIGRSVRSVCVKKRKIRVNKNYSCYSDYYFPSVSGPTANLVFKNRERNAANKIREIREIRVQ